MSDVNVIIPKEEYDLIRTKAELFDHFVEVEEISKEDLIKVQTALKGPFMTKSEFLRRHPELN